MRGAGQAGCVAAGKPRVVLVWWWWLSGPVCWRGVDVLAAYNSRSNVQKKTIAKDDAKCNGWRQNKCRNSSEVTVQTPASDAQRETVWRPADGLSASHWVESPATDQWPVASGRPAGGL